MVVGTIISPAVAPFSVSAVFCLSESLSHPIVTVTVTVLFACTSANASVIVIPSLPVIVADCDSPSPTL